MTTRSPFFKVVCWMGMWSELKRSPLWIWKEAENGAEEFRDGRGHSRDRRRERGRKGGCRPDRLAEIRDGNERWLLRSRQRHRNRHGRAGRSMLCGGRAFRSGREPGATTRAGRGALRVGKGRRF